MFCQGLKSITIVGFCRFRALWVGAFSQLGHSASNGIVRIENGGTPIDIHKTCVLTHENGAFGLDFWGPEEDGSMIYPCSGPAHGEIPVSRGTVSRA